MKDTECVGFLQWALPRLRLHWRGFRKVRGQVCKRVQRRLRQLGLRDTEAYKAHLESYSEEWGALDELCRIPISRFYRDRGVFDRLCAQILPELGRRVDGAVSCWSAGCASGEEPYTLAIAAARAGLALRILGTDADPHMLERARAGRYSWSSLKEMPAEWVRAAFDRDGKTYALQPRYRRRVRFELQDIRDAMPEGPFHGILCRNLVFMYFEEGLQREVLRGIRERLLPGGVLAVGTHESLPEETDLVSLGVGLHQRAPDDGKRRGRPLGS